MLRWRMLLGVLIIAALIALCWLDHRASLPGVWLLPLAVVAAVLATQEVLGLAAAAGLRPLRCTVYFGNVLLVAGAWLVPLAQHWRTGSPFLSTASTQTAEMSMLSALSIAIILVVLGEMWRYEKPGGNTANLAAGVFSLVYVGLLLCFAVQLRLAWGVGAMAAWVIVVKMGDTGAYTVGRLIGRHKMAPRISPGKTIEGAAGAVAFSCLGAWAAFRWLVPALTPDTVATGPSWGWLVFGLLVGLAGMAGDLAESLLKRDVGVKDSSTWLPGFGGVLDILDSLLLSAPVAWLCWAFGLVGR
jgi:phosphatidate cytidylyltransferase